MFPAGARWAIVGALGKPMLPDRMAQRTWLSRGSVAAMCCVAALGLPFVLSQGHTGVVRQTVIRPEPDVPAPTEPVQPAETRSASIPETSMADSTTTIAERPPTATDPATIPTSATTAPAPVPPTPPQQKKPKPKSFGVPTTTTPAAESSPPEPPPSTVVDTTPTSSSTPETSVPPPTEPPTTTTPPPPPPTTEVPPTTIVTEPTTTTIKECKKHCH